LVGGGVVAGGVLACGVLFGESGAVLERLCHLLEERPGVVGEASRSAVPEVSAAGGGLTRGRARAVDPMGCMSSAVDGCSAASKRDLRAAVSASSVPALWRSPRARALSCSDAARTARAVAEFVRRGVGVRLHRLGRGARPASWGPIRMPGRRCGAGHGVRRVSRADTQECSQTTDTVAFSRLGVR
jgi:hypothetical protein